MKTRHPDWENPSVLDTVGGTTNGCLRDGLGGFGVFDGQLALEVRRTLGGWSLQSGDYFDRTAGCSRDAQEQPWNPVSTVILCPALLR